MTSLKSDLECAATGPSISTPRRLAAIRHLAPELLVTPKSQRWSFEEFLRTLHEVEATSRDASNTSARFKIADSRLAKTLEQFDGAQNSVPRATFDYFASLA